MNKPIRHGEVLLYPVNKIPKAESIEAVSRIVGHSESGHHHVLISDQPFEVTETEKHDLYIRLFEPGKLVHQKTYDTHKTLPVPKGDYMVIRKQEYDPFEKIMREVWD